MTNTRLSPTPSEQDLIDDMREATISRRDVEREEWESMEADDRALFELERAEAVHSEGCLFCAGEFGPGDLGRWLRHMSAAHSHDFAKSDLYVVSRALAFLDDEGRRQLGMFALLGDAAVTYAVVKKSFDLKFSKSRAADARARCTAWTALARVFATKVPAGLVQFPAGVDPGATRSGGEALEALVGLVARDLGFLHYEKFASNVGIYTSYKFE